MATDARIGTDLAGYRIDEAIARGGMGVVYRAEQLRLGRKVALKLLAPELAENIGFRTRFEHEMRLAAAIDHPNIIPLYEAGEADGLLFLTMRYIDGSDLKHKLADGPLDVTTALTIAGQVASALDAAHARGLVHRDVKPGNVLIPTAPGAVHSYLTDFGLTKDTSSAIELTATGTFVGTIDYVPPEQIEGSPPDGRSDQYSLAAVFFECLAGHPPFVRDAEVAVMWAHLQDAPPSLSAEDPSLPAALDAVVAKAMAKSPDDRYPSCTAFVEAARRAIGQERRSRPRGPAANADDAAPALGAAGATRISDRADAAPPSLTVPADVTRPAGTVPPPAPETATSPAPETATSPAPETATSPAPETAPAPAPEAAPATVAEKPARRSAAPALAIGLVLVAAAAAAGVLAHSSSSGKSTSAVPSAAHAGPIDVRYGTTWRRGGDTGAIPGLTLHNATALHSGTATLVAGAIARPGPALLPAAVGQPTSSDAVLLGSTPAFRHVLPGGATVYVVPTAAGPLAVGCIGPATSGCDDVAATLRLHGTRALDVRPSSAYARALSTLTGRVADRARAPTAALRSARTSKAQKAPAEALARTYAAAAADGSKLAPPEPAAAANAAIASALRDIGGGYGRLAKAAATHDEGAYLAARGAVARGRAHLAAVKQDLTTLGYRVEG